ncbi:MAG: hypothetical protein D6718_00800 [Acidobacteria bacterium]|nr:MAG: hypothetical protein D6718_00800 [Acidobacteriota bacterium]
MSAPTPSPPPVGLAFLDAELTFVTDDARLHAAVVERLGPFVREPGEGPTFAARIHADPPRVRWDGHELSLPRASVEEHAFGLLFRAALDRVERYLVLHAAAAAKNERALLIAGPSGAGKTTLALALAAGGLRLLSDDFTPLDPADGLVLPFPKAIGARDGAAARIADRLGLEPAPPRPVRPVAPLAPARPALVVLLSQEGAPDPRRPYLFSVTVAGDAEELLRAASDPPHIEPAGCTAGEVRFRVRPGLQATRALEDLLRRFAPRIVAYGAAAEAAFAAAERPVLEPLGAAAALTLLAREVQNRRPGGALMRRLGGDLSKLMDELARGLAGASFAWLRPGPPEPTAALLAQALDEAVRRSSRSG